MLALRSRVLVVEQAEVGRASLRSARMCSLAKHAILEQRSVEEVSAATEMTRDAIYAWGPRFRKLVAELGDEKARPREERR